MKGFFKTYTITDDRLVAILINIYAQKLLNKVFNWNKGKILLKNKTVKRMMSYTEERFYS